MKNCCTGWRRYSHATRVVCGLVVHFRTSVLQGVASKTSSLNLVGGEGCVLDKTLFSGSELIRTLCLTERG